MSVMCHVCRHPLPLYFPNICWNRGETLAERWLRSRSLNLTSKISSRQQQQEGKKAVWCLELTEV